MRVFAALFVALAACGPTAPAPAEPVWNKQACAHCNMILSERASAAQRLTAAGERAFYDDAGCLAADLDDDLDHDGAAGTAWVHGPGDHWIDVRTARFVSGARTPMDFGFVAADDGAASFEDVRAAVRARRSAR